MNKQQAIELGNGTLREDIHYTGHGAHVCSRKVGPRGGVKITI
jgi:hypothetical protein